MKYEQLALGPNLHINSGCDTNGRYYIGSARGCAMFFRDPVALRKFLKLPKGTPSREALDSWLETMLFNDRQRKDSALKEPPAGEGPDHTRMIT